MLQANSKLICKYLLCLDLLCQIKSVIFAKSICSDMDVSLINNWMGREVLGPGGIWGWVQGVGSDHWGTKSQP